jgi:hypothetical protein
MTFEINKQERETNQSLIRRFTKRLRESGILVGAKKSVFHHREKSKQVQRRVTLRKLQKRKDYERAYKLGEKDETKHSRRS